MPSLSVKKVTVASPKRSAASKVVSPKRSVPKTLPPHFMEDALAFFFAIVEPEIVKIHPTYISPTVEEFLYGLKKLNKTYASILTPPKSKRRQTRRRKLALPPRSQAGGTLSENMEILFSVIVGNAIGTFDTPCAKLFSYIAIMLYALWGYKLVSDRLPHPLPGADLALAASDPAGTITSITVAFVQKHIPALDAGMGQFENLLQQYSRRTLANYEADRTRRRWAEHMVVSNVLTTLKMIVNIRAYKLYVVAPLACSLAALGIEPSCWRECAQALPHDLVSADPADAQKPEL